MPARFRSCAEACFANEIISSCYTQQILLTKQYNILRAYIRYRIHNNIIYLINVHDFLILHDPTTIAHNRDYIFSSQAIHEARDAESLMVNLGTKLMVN